MSFTFYVFLYCLLIFLFSYQYKGKNSGLYILLVLPVLVYVHRFIDPPPIVDLPGSKKGFPNLSPIDIFTSNAVKIFEAHHKFEYGFILLLKIVRCFTGDFGIFLVINTSLLLGCYVLVTLRYSVNVGISILMLLLIVFDQSIFVLRQHLSIAIVLLSIPSIIERKFFRFTLIVIIASVLHKSTLIWFVMYFLYGIKSPLRIFLSLGIIAIGVTLIFKNLSFLNNFLSLGYASYINGDKTGQSNLVSFFMSLMMFCIYVLICGKNVLSDGIMRLCTLALYVHVVISFVGIQLSLLSRFGLVFNTSLLFIIPIVYENIKSDIVRFAYLFMCLCIYGYTTYFGSFSAYMFKCRLYMFNAEEMICFLIFTMFTLYVAIKSRSRALI